MAKAEAGTGNGTKSRKACCLVSEVLEEMGLNARKAREMRRQTLLGLMTFCQWQLARMDEHAADDAVDADEPKKTRGRRVKVV